MASPMMDFSGTDPLPQQVFVRRQRSPIGCLKFRNLRGFRCNQRRRPFPGRPLKGQETLSSHAAALKQPKAGEANATGNMQ